MVEGLKLARGKAYRDKYYYFNPDAQNVSNPHSLIVGTSGSGKTTLLKEIIRYYNENDKVIFIIDFHGDLKTDDENLLEFTPRNSPNGINPFELEMSPKGGGVDVQSELIAIMMGTYFMDNMGQKQKIILKQLIIDTYASKGIYDNDVSTWGNRLPVMRDLGNLCIDIEMAIAKEKKGDIQSSAASKINELKGHYKGKKINNPESQKLVSELMSKIEEVDKLSKKVESEVEEFIADGEDTTFEEKYPDIKLSFYVAYARTLESLFAYIKEVASMSIFNDNKPSLQPGINRFDFSSIVAIDKPLIAKFLSEFIAQKLFRSSMIRGEYADLPDKRVGSKYDRVLIIDESKLAMPQGKEKDNPFNIINRIVSESRKYGLSLCIVSQRLNHYTDEILSNIFTKIILKVKPYDYKTVSKALGIDIEVVKDTFDSNNSYPAIIETFGANKHSYILEDIRKS